MRSIYVCLCIAAVVEVAVPAPSGGFVFPEERRRDKKLDSIITPPVLPVLEHLERDPSTLLPSERRAPQPVKPRFGFGGGFNVAPSNGGLTASISSSANGAGASQAASQSFSFGFNEGFSASHSASQASSFNGFGSDFSGSQASSQAASFNGGGTSVSGAASSASAFGGGSGSQSASSAFGFNNNGYNSNGFNTLNGFQPPDATFGEGLLDVRHRGVPSFPFPNFPKGFGAGAFRSSRPSARSRDSILTTFVVSD